MNNDYWDSDELLGHYWDELAVSGFPLSDYHTRPGAKVEVNHVGTGHTFYYTIPESATIGETITVPVPDSKVYKNFGRHQNT